MTDAGARRRDDGGLVAGEVAEGVTLVKNARVVVRDGTRLAADLYLPTAAMAEGRPVSVVMEYIPYRKDEVVPGSRFYEYLPQQGYAVARVDIRGTGASPGVSLDEYLPLEQQDGVDAVEWLAAQPWCTGHVNMMGISYGGFTSLQVASHAPEHLTSIIPMFFTDDRYTDDCHFRGGLMRKYYDVSMYGNMMCAWNALPAYPEWSEDWGEVWEEHLAGNEPYLLEWFRHQTDSDYWRNGSVGHIAGRITCPAFLIGGWRDGYPNPPLRLFSSLNVPKKVLDRTVGSPPTGRRGTRTAHRPSARGRALARPLVWRGGQRRHGRAADRRVHAEGRPPDGRSARVRGRLACRDGLARRRRSRARPAPGRGQPARGRGGGRRRRRADLRPDRRRHRPAVVRRPALRPPRRPATRRGALPDLHLAAAGGGHARPRPSRRPAPRRLHGERDRLLREPERRAARRDVAPRGEGHAERHPARIDDRPGGAAAGRARPPGDRAGHDRLGLPAWPSAAAVRGQRRLAERLADAATRDEPRPPRTRGAVARRLAARAGRGQRRCACVPALPGRRRAACERRRPTRVAREARRADRPRRGHGGGRGCPAHQPRDARAPERSSASCASTGTIPPRPRPSAAIRPRSSSRPVTRRRPPTSRSRPLPSASTSCSTVEVQRDGAPVFSRRWVESVPRVLL